MFLTEYLSNITKIIDEYSRTGLILSSEIAIDSRTEKIGLLKGSIIFINESRLFFTEYLDLRFKIDKITYSFHYQDKDVNLFFRYDNAAHKPKIDHEHHKHIGSSVFQSEIPDLKDVLEEIISNLLV